MPTPQNPGDNCAICRLNRDHQPLCVSGGKRPPTDTKFPSRGDTMRQSLALGSALGLAFGLGLAFADSASAQIKLGVGGPITRRSPSFGAQLKDRTQRAAEGLTPPPRLPPP